MTRETYPAPRSRLRLAAAPSPQEPEFGATRDEYETRLFRTCDIFNVVRFKVNQGSEIATFDDFAAAVRAAHPEPRALIYAANSFTGNAFCIPRNNWNRYAEIYLEMRDGKVQAFVKDGG